MSTKIEKIGMVSIHPSRRVTGWVLESAGIYSVSLPYYVIEVRSTRLVNEFDESPDNTPAVNEYYYDAELKKLYVGFGVNPDTNTYPGLTVKFQLSLASTYLVHNIEPVLGGDLVEWLPGLISIPQAQNGSSDYLYGFSPFNESQVRYSNLNGSLSEILHDTSFNLAECRAYTADVLNGKVSNFIQVFLGYTSNFSLDEDGTISISTVDYSKFFEREADFLDQRLDSDYVRFNLTSFPNIEPAAIRSGEDNGWFIRDVRGMVDGFRAVNVDYSASPTTSNNRRWITHYHPAGDSVGSIQQFVDHLAANSTTRTYFVLTPQVNVGDWVVIVNNGVTYRTEVEVVNRGLKYIDHEPLGARTFTAADTVDRYYIARVIVEDQDGQSWWLEPGLDYTLISDAGSSSVGFLMANNWEASQGFTYSPFDPSIHKMYVRVYGSKNLQNYTDATPVGEVVDNGGIRAQAVSLLYNEMASAGFFANYIDINSFDTIGANSHALGYAIPSQHDAARLPRYIDIILPILTSMLWRLSFVQSAGSVFLGITELTPFVSSADYDALEEDHYGFSYSHDYTDIYKTVLAEYFIKDQSDSSLTDLLPTSFIKISLSARDLHGATGQYDVSLLQYDGLEADVIAKRYSYALGERRGFYSIKLGQDFLNNTDLGASYQLYRENLPGYNFTFGDQKSRQLSLIEVQKSTNGVTITLEDQKAIQDNSGDW